jgi:outer membrane protein TolC
MLAKKTRVLLILLVLFSCNLRAQFADTEILTLDQCLALALDQNPLILSAIHRHQASVARIDQATSFPVPSIDFESDVQPQHLTLCAPKRHI